VIPGPPALTLVDGDGTVRWEAAPTAGFTTAMQAAVGDGVVVGVSYCDGPGTVKAWDAGSGHALWSAVLPNSLGGGVGALIAEHLALVQSAAGLAAVDSHTGEPRWQAVGRLAYGVGGDTVVTSTLDVDVTSATSLMGLDLATGATRWTAELPAGQHLDGVAVDDAQAYASAVSPGGAEEVVAFALADGAELWRATLAPGSDRSSVEAAAGAAIGWAGDIPGIATAAVDGVSGRERWRADGWGLPQQQSPSVFVGDGNVYVQGTQVGDDVGALDAESGAKRWSTSVVSLGGTNDTIVSAADGGLLVAVDDVVMFLAAADGTPRWRRPSPEVFLGSGDDGIAFGPECPNLGD
jgi:outer membrane protein assembly factor BamB